MRTNIELDDGLVREARKYSQATSKRALVEEALRTLIETRAEARRRESYAQRLSDLQTRLANLRLRESPSALLRQDRSR